MGPPANSAEGQTYCLRWNNHKSNMVEILDSLIKIETYVDCTIIVDDQITFKAHRVVLAANSPYFQAILKDVPMDHCSIIFPGVKAFEMRALLEYMYTGEVNVTQSQIPKIMRIAEELEVKGLFDMADLKEKFNKLSEEHAERSISNPYANSSAPIPPYTSASTSSPSSSSVMPSGPHNGGVGLAGGGGGGGVGGLPLKENDKILNNSSSAVISTSSLSSNLSPSGAPTSSSSPPLHQSYKQAYANLYTKSNSGTSSSSSTAAAAAAALQKQSLNDEMSTSQSQAHSQVQSSNNQDHPQWSLTPAAAAMLSSVYESAPDMNPLKRKKISSLTSMLMNRDTPILRNVLAQANPADSSQPMPLVLPGSIKTEPINPDNKHGILNANNNHNFNGSDYGSDKQKYHEEPHSPFTDRSFDDESFDGKHNYNASFNATANQKPEWKRYKQYTRQDIMSAIQCVRDGMSALQASRKFGVPSRTLYDKVKKLGITTGRPMNRSMKRSPNSLENPATYSSYSHGLSQNEPLLSSMHETNPRPKDERDSKEHLRAEHHHLPSTISHPAAALLDHAFLQQALENRGGDIAGREALHAMALAAAAHAAANRMSSSPGPNGNIVRTPSPGSYASATAALKYSRSTAEQQDMMMEREKERQRYYERNPERERDEDREGALEIDERDEERLDDQESANMSDDDKVEDLSVSRKPNDLKIPVSPYSNSSPPPSQMQLPPVQNFNENSNGSLLRGSGGGGSAGCGAVSGSKKLPANSSSGDDDFISESGSVHREMMSDDNRTD